MRMLDLLPIGEIDPRLLQDVAPALADAFRIPCRIRQGDTPSFCRPCSHMPTARGGCSV